MPTIPAADVCAQGGCGLPASSHAQIVAQVPVASAAGGYYSETIYVCPQSLHSETIFVAQLNFGT